jgi:hypothetical protein
MHQLIPATMREKMAKFAKELDDAVNEKREGTYKEGCDVAD